MDAKNIENSRLTVTEYNNLIMMLNASKEDYEIAIENISNIKDESEEWKVILRLMYKELTFSRRYSFNESFNIHNRWNKTDKLDYSVIYDDIVSINSDLLKRLFIETVKDNLYNTYSSAYPFIKDLNISIKW